MQMLKKFGQDTFASFGIRNFRLYFMGHVISQSGSWMQTVALGWLVLELTSSGTQLGIITALQFIPLLILGPWGGLFADRHSKKHILYGTQVTFFVLIVALSLIVFLNLTEVWMLYIFSFGLGMVRIFDNPARQTFIVEMVSHAYVKNAVSLNSTGGNLARVIGPAIGALLITWFSIAASFLFNAFSHLVTVLMLLCMRDSELHTTPREEKKDGQLKEGFKYVMETPLIKSTLIMMAFIGTFAYEFQVSLPLLAERVFQGDAGSYAALLSAFGIGSVIGGLFAAGRHTVVPHRLADITILFGVSLISTSLAPHLEFAIIGMLFVGFFSINLIALGNTMIQLESKPEMRGRVLSLWSMAMIGSTAVGGPIVGIIGEYFGARWGLAIGGIVAIMVALYVSRTLMKDRFHRLIPAWMVREPLHEQ